MDNRKTSQGEKVSKYDQVVKKCKTENDSNKNIDPKCNKITIGSFHVNIMRVSKSGFLMNTIIGSDTEKPGYFVKILRQYPPLKILLLKVLEDFKAIMDLEKATALQNLKTTLIYDSCFVMATDINHTFKISKENPSFEEKKRQDFRLVRDGGQNIICKTNGIFKLFGFSSSVRHFTF